MNFSIILPSRERIHLLESLLDSVVNTADQLDLLEMWVAVDWDDQETTFSIKRLCKKYNFLQFLVTDRQNNLSVGYYNKLAFLSKGRFIQVLNDDCLFQTKSWDTLGLEVLENYQYTHPDGVVYGNVLDNSGVGYSCFPLISRQAFDTVGWFFHPEMTAWGADIHLNEVYSIVDRVVQMPYKIQHISHHTNTRQRDNVNYRLASISNYNYASAKGEANRLKNILSAIDNRRVFI